MRRRLILLLVVGVILLFIPIAKLFLPLSKAEYDVVSLFNGEEAYDVIVIGGEPEGVAAAVSAARSGAKTLLVEHRDGLGGLMTYGRLNYIDLGLDKDKKPANAGLFKEWHKMVGGGIAFDVDKAQEAFTKLTEDEPNLTVLLDSDIKAINLTRDQHTIEGILALTPDGKKVFTAKRFIDSTANADFAAMAGVPYFVGQEDIGLKNTKMSVTLMIHLKNVDWEKLKQVAAKKTFGEASVDDKVAWGFWGVSEQYKPHLPNTRLRGMNIARQSDGTIYINALQIFGVNGLSEESRKKAIEQGKVETKYIVEFLNNHFPGFENASIADFPPELYVRETRHIKALYQLSIQDVWENKDQWDSIGFGSYPVDIQATTPTGKDEIVVNPKQYAIPFRSLIPVNFNNLLVASRSSGYSSLAAGSARIIPTGMSAGEAAGLASSISIKRAEYFPKMIKDKPAVQLLQKRLIGQGAHLYHFNISYPYEGKWVYPSLVPLYSEGLIYAGYTNDLHLDDKMTEKEFITLIEKGVKRTNPKRYGGLTWPDHLKKVPLTRDRAASLVLGVENMGIHQHPWDYLAEKAVINDELHQRLPENRALSKGEAYVLAAQIISKP